RLSRLSPPRTDSVSGWNSCFFIATSLCIDPNKVKFGGHSQSSRGNIIQSENRSTSVSKAKKQAVRKTRTSRPTNGIALKKTVSKRQRQPHLQFLAWQDIEREELTPLLYRQLIVGQEVMLARILLKKGCIVPWHSHVNEQLSSIFEGALKFWIDGKEIVVRAGEVLVIPPSMPHKAE